MSSEDSVVAAIDEHRVPAQGAGGSLLATVPSSVGASQWDTTEDGEKKQDWRRGQSFDQALRMALS